MLGTTVSKLKIAKKARERAKEAARKEDKLEAKAKRAREAAAAATAAAAAHLVTVAKAEQYQAAKQAAILQRAELLDFHPELENQLPQEFQSDHESESSPE